MITFIVLFLPALFMTAWKCKISERGQSGYKRFLIDYLCNVLFLNLIVIAIVYLLSGNRESIADSLDQHTGFMLKYLILAVLLAFALPYFGYRKNNISSRINMEKTAAVFTKYGTWILYLYAFILFGMNLLRCFDTVIWGDEGYTIKLAKMSIPQFLEETAVDVHPPLYYFFPWIFENLFGGGYHFATVITYGIVLLTGVTWIRKKFGVCNAALFITLATFVGDAVTNNVEIRMYSMASMFVLLAFIELYEILHTFQWKHFLLFALFSLGAAYTHYYALFTVAFFYLFLLVFIVKKREIAGKVLAVCAFTVVGYLPWLFVFLSALQTKVTQEWWMTTYVSFADCRKYIFQGPFEKELFLLYAVLILLVFIVESRLLNFPVDKTDAKWKVTMKVGKPKSTPLIEWIFAGVLALFGTMFLGMVASILIRPVFALRYLFPALGIAWLTLAACIARFRKSSLFAFLLTAGILLAYVPQYNTIYQSERMKQQETKETLEKTSEISEDSLLVTNVLSFGWTVFDYYYPEISHRLMWDLNDVQLLGTSEEVWIFWKSEIDEETMLKLNEEGYVPELVQTGYLGDNYTYIYKIKQ